MFMEISNEVTKLEAWERTFVIQDKIRPESYFHCRIFKNPEIDVPHFRIDEIHVLGMIRIEIGGGWKSWEEIPDVRPDCELSWYQIEPLFKKILGRIQDEYPTFELEFSYEPHEDDVDEDELGFRW